MLVMVCAESGEIAKSSENRIKEGKNFMGHGKGAVFGLMEQALRNFQSTPDQSLQRVRVLFHSGQALRSSGSPASHFIQAV